MSDFLIPYIVVLPHIEECHIFSALDNLVKRLCYKVKDGENIVTLANKMFFGVCSEAFQQRKERKELDYALWPKLHGKYL